MTIFEELKSIGKVLQEAGKIEQYQQILETQQQLLEMQRKINELETENIRLNEEFKIKELLIPKDNSYWIEYDETTDGPFCTSCWDSSHKLIRLHKSMNSGKIDCPVCKTIAVHGTVNVFKPIDHYKNSAM